jgi:UDP-N-acetylmuramoyl-tripeptide--D-alanyl-D-alanine ligase
MRSEVRSLGSLTLLVDCYNANPQSLRAALELLEAIQRPGPRVAVLGSMLELGPDTAVLHQKALEDTLSFPLDLVVVTGLFAEAAGNVELPREGPEVVVAPDLEEANGVLLRALRGSEVVLLKASRGVAMERLIPSLEERFGPGKAA